MSEAIVSLADIRRWRPCSFQIEKVEALYPDGVPITLLAALTLEAQGVDVIWGATHLLNREQCSRFIVFTLRQRQPTLVKLFQMLGLDEHAEAIAALDWEDRKRNVAVLAAARAGTLNAKPIWAAWDAWDAVGDVWNAAKTVGAATWAAAWAAAWAALAVPRRGQIKWLLAALTEEEP